MKRYMSLMLLIAGIAVVSCNRPSKSNNLSSDTASGHNNIRPYPLENVSLVTLIANSKEYNGRKVRVIGYLNLEFEGNGIYLNEEDYNQSISKNGLWVEMDKNSSKLPGVRLCNRRYVLMEGTFDAGNQGHMGAFSGAIKDIKRLEARSVVFVTSPNPKRDNVHFPPPTPPPSAADKQ